MCRGLEAFTKRSYQVDTRFRILLLVLELQKSFAKLLVDASVVWRLGKQSEVGKDTRRYIELTANRCVQIPILGILPFVDSDWCTVCLQRCAGY